MIPNPATFYDSMRGRATGAYNFFVGIPNAPLEAPSFFGLGPSVHDMGVPLFFDYGTYDNATQRTAGFQAQIVLTVGSFAIGGESGGAENVASETVFSGHGGYEMIGKGLNYTIGSGITTVPEGTSVTVYSKFGTTISDSLGNAIETNTVPKGTFFKTYSSGSRMPNFTLYPPEGLVIKGNPITVSQPTRLDNLLKPNMGNCHWAACSSIVFAPR